jgi:hypothetical protein
MYEFPVVLVSIALTRFVFVRLLCVCVLQWRRPSTVSAISLSAPVPRKPASMGVHNSAMFTAPNMST